MCAIRFAPLIIGSAGGHLAGVRGREHAVGAAPNATPNAYWPGWDIAKGVAT